MLRNFEEIQRAEDLGLVYPPCPVVCMEVAVSCWEWCGSSTARAGDTVDSDKNMDGRESAPCAALTDG